MGACYGFPLALRMASVSSVMNRSTCFTKLTLLITPKGKTGLCGVIQNWRSRGRWYSLSFRGVTESCRVLRIIASTRCNGKRNKGTRLDFSDAVGCAMSRSIGIVEVTHEGSNLKRRHRQSALPVNLHECQA